MSDKKRDASPQEEELADMSLPDLKQLLKGRGDARPKYMFSAVEQIPEFRDYHYVFWLDLMGARNMMKLSLPRAARSVMKIHAAALFTKRMYPDLEINPVMDGVYGFVKEKVLLQQSLAEILRRLANVFVHENVASSRFMVRAGVAYGPLVPGSSLAAGAKILQKNRRYLGGTAIGMGISHAYEAEGSAPPFGVYIHESARAFAPQGDSNFPYHVNLWRWANNSDALTWALRRALVAPL